MAAIRSFRDLDVYALAREQAKNIFQISKSFPPEERYSLAWLDHAIDCGYLDPSQHHVLDDAWQKVGAMLNRIIQRADDFCRSAKD